MTFSLKASADGLTGELQIGGVPKVIVDNGGNLSIGTPSTGYRLWVKKADAISTTPGSNFLARLESNGAGADCSLQFSDGVANSATLSMQGSNLTYIGAGALGYGIGAGGTVTQATSKSTAVTLNKPCGQITMNAASLAAGAAVIFHVTNSITTNKDIVVATVVDDFGASYVVQTLSQWDGYFELRLVNISGGALAQAVRINFAIIKGTIA